MAVLAVVTSLSLDLPLRDPDGFLGPAYLRLPILVGGAFFADLIPRTIWRSHFDPRQFKRQARLIVREHWTRERIQLVLIGLLSFYATYVSYRNLKNFLPFLRVKPNGDPITYDNFMLRLDHRLLLGHDPATVLHHLLGTGVSAYVLSWVYLIFLPMVPIAVIAWVVWSRNVSFGYWFVTADCMAWSLGTLSYYLIPTLGPNFQAPYLYKDLPDTGVASLQDSLISGRHELRFDPFINAVQSVAGFASLHVGITLMMALVAQYTVRNRLIKIVLWTDVVLVTISTTYFGWHYIADDIAGAFIAVFSFWIGAVATGQRFDRRGRSSHPTTTTSRVPVDVED
ncbi:inositol phosphorylceramide synthase [Nocardioides mangrovicus]|uniref:Inositol phosphorylceramide synthase n=2 Tax=Nocardioides mangrovicus TaxID=2478913 RepID=A0A3L8P7J1_9ACTN|nr:inositol phosphorylceramide synthase [Nocardioides mangrovicus]